MVSYYGEKGDRFRGDNCGEGMLMIACCFAADVGRIRNRNGCGDDIYCRLW